MPPTPGSASRQDTLSCDSLQSSSSSCSFGAVNGHDSQAAIPMVDAIPPIKTPDGGRRRRPDELLGGRAYDVEAKIRRKLRRQRITPLIAKRNTEHGRGLGKYRYVVDACLVGYSTSVA